MPQIMLIFERLKANVRSDAKRKILFLIQNNTDWLKMTTQSI